MKIRPAGIWMIAACAIAVLPTVQAQSYPSRPITLVVGAAPGDAADIASRVMAEELAKYLKTPIVAVNRPGAGGLLGPTAWLRDKRTATRSCLQTTARLHTGPFSN